MNLTVFQKPKTLHLRHKKLREPLPTSQEKRCGIGCNCSLFRQSSPWEGIYSTIRPAKISSKAPNCATKMNVTLLQTINEKRRYKATSIKYQSCSLITTIHYVSLHQKTKCEK